MKKMEADPQGRLADNIVYFARALRKAGLRVGPASVTDAIEAVMAAGIGTREDFYWTLHSVLITRHEDTVVFDEAFRLFWRSRELIEKMLAMFSPQAPNNKEREKQRAGESRVADAMFEGHRKKKEAELPPEVEVDAHMTASGREVLRSMDFARMNAAELAAAKAAIRDMVIPHDEIRSRRFEASHRGAMDPRATLRKSLRSGGDLVLPQFRKRRTIKPPIVVIADISGSMSQYSRIFLHFAYELMQRRSHVHVFVFGTRLTNITRQLRHKDVDEALDNCIATVNDWSGGTRIGATLAEFNRLWSRRVLGQGASVLLMSDGLEREGVDELAKEMDRLHRSCRRLIWLNPLLRFEGFEPKARGIAAMMDHVDEFRAIHSLNSIADLCLALGSHKAPYQMARGRAGQTQMPALAGATGGAP